MPQIPQDQLNELKARIPILELCRSRGLDLKPVGADWKALCPFHPEKTPSFTVTPEKGLYHCFGCERGGDVFSFVMEADQVDFPAAARTLKAYAGEKETAEPVETEKIRHHVSDRLLLEQITNHYRTRFRENTRGLNYLTERGITRPETLEAFHAGYCDETFTKRLPKSSSGSGREMREHLLRLGIINKEDRHERYRGYVVFPTFGAAGEVLQLYGRVISNPNKKRATHMLLPAPVAGVVNGAALESEEIILCESVLDAMSFHQHGFENVTATLGAGNVTDELLDFLVDKGVKRVFIAFDGDEAGDRGADKVSLRLGERGIEALRVVFPDGTDACEFLCQTSAPERVVRALLEQALPPGESLKGFAIKQPESPEIQAVSEPVKPGAPADLLKKNGVEIVEREGDVCEATFGDRFYRIFGLTRNRGLELLRVNVRLYLERGHFAESLDLASHKHQERFAESAGGMLELKPEIVKRDLERLLLALEEIQYERLYGEKSKEAKRPELTEKERDDALAFLKSPELVKHIRKDFRDCGVAGEEMNLVAGYLAATSRLLSKPIHILIQSSSAAGKSTLMKAILNLMPPEDVMSYSALTGQALYYMQDKNLKHKILAMEEDEGADRAKYVLKMLQTEGKASIATTIKDPGTGHMTTGDYSIEGPIAAFSTSTAVWLDEEVQNRYMILATDESREQTERILNAQRFNETLQGWDLRDRREFIFKRHRNAQRLLRSFMVVNPLSEKLGFLNTRHRLRRDHEKYQALIRAVTLLFQHQRPVKRRENYGKTQEYIETTAADIVLANEIANEVLGRSLDDMPPHTRGFLARVHELAESEAKKRKMDRRDVRLSRRVMSEHTGLSMAQVYRHLQKLMELEYVLVHFQQGSRQQFYEVLYRGEGMDGQPFLPGLPDIVELQKELELAAQGNKDDDTTNADGGAA